MKTVTISEAKAKLSALVEAAERGEDVLIMRGAKPAVTLTPVTEADLALWPAVPGRALAGFEREIVTERAADELKLMGKTPTTAARKLRR
ncbi:MAG: type II toxin-antitoxin system Phd/YefM family antitoxin [Opitutaceae bacterium]